MANPYSVYDQQIGLNDWLQQPLLGLGVFEDLSSQMTSISSGALSDPITDAINPSNTLSGSEVGAILAYGKKSFLDTTEGFYQGLDTDGTYKWIIGGATSSIDWNVTADGTLTVNGTIVASSGTIGGWTINATTLTGGDTTLDSTGVITLGTGNNIVKLSSVDATYRIWVGNATAASAPFSVTKAGALLSTSATITGVITANTGFIGGASGWVIAANTIKDVAGVVGLSNVVTGGDDIRIWAGNVTPASAPFYVTEAGALVASSATVTGVVTANTGFIGGSSGWVIAANTIKDTAGLVGFSNAVTGGDDIRIWAGNATPASAPFYVTESGALVATSATISGSVTATSGTIGGFSIGADYIRDAANSFGMASTVTGGDDVRFWAGDTFANRATAPFHVTEAGAVTATSITLSTSVSLNGSSLTATGTNLNTVTAGNTTDVDTLHTHTDLASGINSFMGVAGSGTSNFVVKASGFSDATQGKITTTVYDSGNSDVTFQALEVAVDSGAGVFFFDLDKDSTATATVSCGLYISTDFWAATDDGTAGDRICKNGSSVTISGTTPSADAMLGHDPGSSYLLVMDSTTRIRRYSGISGTTITFVDSITLDTAVSLTAGFLFDDTNNRYICVDLVNNLIRRFNSSGTTIDTQSYTVTDTYLRGVALIANRVYLVMQNDSAVSIGDDRVYHVDLIPTLMIR